MHSPNVKRIRKKLQILFTCVDLHIASTSYHKTMWCDSHLEVRIHVLLTACGLKRSDKIGNWGELYKKKKKILES
jgi:hypothetical protein